MKVTVHVPSMLQRTVGGAAELTVTAATVRGVLEKLEKKHEPLYRCICDETGSMRRHVNLFVNSDLVRELDGLDTKLRAGDILTILPAVSGG